MDAEGNALMGDVLLMVGNLIAFGTMIGIVLVWIAYGVLFKWRKTRPGRALYYLLTALVLSFILSVMTIFFGLVWGPPEWELRNWFRILVWGTGAFATFKMAWGLRDNWRRAGNVIDLETRARRAQARLEGKPTTKETPIQ